MTTNQQSATPFTGNLRDLVKQRTQTKIRRIHKQWFCFDPSAQAELDAANQHLADLIGEEVLKQQVNRNTSRKYSMPGPIVEAERARDEVRDRVEQSGAMGVFQNLDDDQLDTLDDFKTAFEKARATLLSAFVRWETVDGTPIPAEDLGREDLDALLQPDVVERGEWLPLAANIVNQSNTPFDRPTLPAR